ncbi:MAG: HD domain-containing protein, partial [Bacteroidales bacterium]|jgi:dGTPase|nr:HD domain-containing protein [Bacteroidales bacterium]
MKKFQHVSINPNNPKWAESIARQTAIENKPGEIRTDFTRDYNRILHCTAYRRLKHKTQVFFSPKDENVCTRIEHVNHVTAVSNTISEYLGLNTELTNAIAIGHDLGHAPFGHSGEVILKKIIDRELHDNFWHERNSLRVIDKIELLENSDAKLKNLNLTYAVRDGIVSHCGEVDERSIIPRDVNMDLDEIRQPGSQPPYTWEGCVVKISDKISYLGRDIEDALRMNILNDEQLSEFRDILGHTQFKHLNNTTLMHSFVVDLCEHSSPEEGIKLSDELVFLMNEIKKFNYKYIYKHKRLQNYVKYADLILNTIYETLIDLYAGERTINNINQAAKIHAQLSASFSHWLKYYTLQLRWDKDSKFQNEILYDLTKREDYVQAIIDFIASLTDRVAIELFEELTTF